MIDAQIHIKILFYIQMYIMAQNKCIHTHIGLFRVSKYIKNLEVMISEKLQNKYNLVSKTKVGVTVRGISRYKWCCPGDLKMQFSAELGI